MPHFAFIDSDNQRFINPVYLLSLRFSALIGKHIGIEEIPILFDGLFGQFEFLSTFLSYHGVCLNATYLDSALVQLRQGPFPCAVHEFLFSPVGSHHVLVRLFLE